MRTNLKEGGIQLKYEDEKRKTQTDKDEGKKEQKKIKETKKKTIKSQPGVVVVSYH